uniref:Apolipoprotein N-acyltransferase n=1 Tax=Magnetococcus massalia (strain MO-1) TaxID=451514 RepID=A0A1S7LF98_MAGMO|nr:Apolipoprotein N-acyltransferase [Candidatus Magnetococcus massalia]
MPRWADLGHTLLSRSKGWLLANLLARDSLLVLLAGVLAALGLPPWGLPLVALAALVLLLFLLHDVAVKRAVWLGFLFGIAHFSFAFQWLHNSLHAHGGAPYLLASLGVGGLAAVVALYTALVAGLLSWSRLSPLLLPPAFASLWVSVEWLRGTLFSGFPWTPLGLIWSDLESLMQVADLGGVALLSGLTALLAGALRLLLDPKLSQRLRIGWLVVVAGLFTAAHLYGQMRLAEPLESSAERPPYRIALVQGYVPQLEKWDKGWHDAHFKRYLDLTLGAGGQAAGEAVDLVVWPETAMAFFLQAFPERRQELATLLATINTPLLAGVPTAAKQQEGGWHYANSMLMLDRQGGWQQIYRKHHLVPFGEYMPMRWLLPDSLEKLTIGDKDFTPGEPSMGMAWHRGLIGPLVCYEVIFPELVRQLANRGMQLLVNVTNDGWFGAAARPQHLQMSRMRAIENRLPLVRVANTGISASFDAWGRELGRLPEDAPAMAIHLVPQAPQGGSLYRQIGGWLPLVWGGAALLLVAWGRWRFQRV